MLQKILILDKDLSICQKFSSFLRNSGYITASTSCNKEALQLIKSSDFDLILCDSELKNTYPVDFILKIKSLRPDIPIISISDTDNVQTAVELMKSGVFYFMPKPINPERLLDIVKSAIMESIRPEGQAIGSDRVSSVDNKGDNGAAQPIDRITKQGYPYVRGISDVAKKLYKAIDLVAPTDYTVIVHGETGTGKESVARMIHEKSDRNKGPFLAVDCGSLSKELAASELFGHEKGSFTGALHSREGAFYLANGGTLFLDEIGNLTYDVQLLLLRAIQERVIRKVGSTIEKPVNVRLIVASNEDLYECVIKRKFREDLYHRLNEFSLTVPALRDRKEDLGLFIENFVLHAAKRLNKDLKLPTPAAMEILEAYHWPGNIRELLNTVKKACLFTPDGKAIAEQYLPFEVKLSANLFMEEDIRGKLPVNEFGNIVSQGQVGCKENIAKKEISLKDIASNAELNKILVTLRSVKFNKSKAAEMLNIDRKTLYNKLKKINI